MTEVRKVRFIAVTFATYDNTVTPPAFVSAKNLHELAQELEDKFEELQKEGRDPTAQYFENIGFLITAPLRPTPNPATAALLASLRSNLPGSEAVEAAVRLGREYPGSVATATNLLTKTFSIFDGRDASKVTDVELQNAIEKLDLDAYQPSYVRAMAQCFDIQLKDHDSNCVHSPSESCLVGRLLPLLVTHFNKVATARTS